MAYSGGNTAPVFSLWGSRRIAGDDVFSSQDTKMEISYSCTVVYDTRCHGDYFSFENDVILYWLRTEPEMNARIFYAFFSGSVVSDSGEQQALSLAE